MTDWLKVYLMDEGALEILVRQFEDGTLPIENWHHETHLAICCWYVIHDPDPMYRLRTGIRDYVAATGGVNGPASGYHETLTRFWMQVVDHCLKSLSDRLPLMNKIRFTVEMFSQQKHYHRKFYPPDDQYNILTSEEARERWMSPEEINERLADGEWVG